MSFSYIVKAYRTAAGVVVERQGEARHIDIRWDDLFAARDDTHGWLAEQFTSGARCQSPADILAPIGSQEVWAAGVTYWRSRTARMEESKKAGGGSFYDLV